MQPREFFRRRARRILPPFYASAAATMLIYVALSHAWPVPNKKGWLVNALLLQDILPHYNNINVPFWSVAVEWKIYFLFPALVFVWQRFGPVAALAAATLPALVVTGTVFMLWPQKDFSHTCPWFLALFAMGLCAGGATQSAVRGRWLAPFAWVCALTVALLVVAFPATVFGQGPAFQRILVLLDLLAGGATAAFLLVLSGAPSCSAVLRALSWQPLVWLGTISYSIYLLHLPLLEAAHLLLVSLLPGNDHAYHRALGLMTLGAAFAISCAFVFHLAFERPFMSRPAPKTEREAEVAAIVSPAP